MERRLKPQSPLHLAWFQQKRSHLVSPCWLKLLRWCGGKRSRPLKKELQILLPAYLGIGKSQSQSLTHWLSVQSCPQPLLEERGQSEEIRGSYEEVVWTGEKGKEDLWGAPTGHSSHLGGCLAPPVGMLQGHLCSFQLSEAQ